jgi:hypothetical protein
MLKLSQLNGWYRLGVVGGAMWAIRVLVISTVHWPKPTSVPNVAVYRAMNPLYGSELRRFLDGPYGLSTMRANAPDDLLSDEARQGLANGTWQEVKPPDQWLETTVQVEGRFLEFDPISEAVRSDSAKAAFREDVIRNFKTTLRALISQRRREFAIWATVFWFVPLVFVYAIGLSVAWVRCGFRHGRA